MILSRVLLAIAGLLALGDRSLIAKTVSTECDVRGVYSEMDAPPGTMVKTMAGDLDEVELILGPARLQDGHYAVTVTRKGSNLYRDERTGLYIITRYCYEYVYSEPGVLRFESIGSLGRGSLAFGHQ